MGAKSPGERLGGGCEERLRGLSAGVRGEAAGGLGRCQAAGGLRGRPGGGLSSPLSAPRRLLPSYPRYRGNRPGSPSPAPPLEPEPEPLGSRLPPPAMELLAAALSAACALDQDDSGR